MIRYEGEALVLRVVEHGESDLIVRMLTPETGRLTAIAKGARRSVRRFPGTLDVFNLLFVGVRQRRRTSMGFLEQARLRSPFLELRRDARRYALASYLCELFDRMAPEGAHRADAKRIFDFARRAFGALGQVEPDASFRLLLELRALEALGLRPELSHCVRCGKAPRSAGQIGFNVADGGLVCSTCNAGQAPGAVIPVHLGTLKILQQGLEYDLERLSRLSFGGEALKEASQLLFRFQRYHVGFELRSERFLADCFDALPPGRG